VPVLLDVDAAFPARDDAAVNDESPLAVRVRDGAEHPLEFGENPGIVDPPAGGPEDLQATNEWQGEVVVVESLGLPVGEQALDGEVELALQVGPEAMIRPTAASVSNGRSASSCRISDVAVRCGMESESAIAADEQVPSCTFLSRFRDSECSGSGSQMQRFESFSIGAGWCQALSDYSVDWCGMFTRRSSLLFGIGTWALP
jgi:hypothetical protein